MSTRTAKANKDDPPLIAGWPVAVASGESGAHAIARILLHYLDILVKLEEGVIAAQDIEYLHKFRVALRRSRSLIESVRRLFPPAALHAVRLDMRWLGRVASPVRDLDVFLADFATIQRAVPLGHRKGSAALRKTLLDLHGKAHIRLTQALRSKRYRLFKENWGKFLALFPLENKHPAKADRPINRLADRAITRQYRQLGKLSKHIDGPVPIETLHELRKDIKRLRYLIEAFASLYPAAEIERVQTQLVGFQDSLGKVVDCAAQRLLLKQWRKQMQDAASPASLYAIEALQAALTDREVAAREEFVTHHQGALRTRDRPRM
jgi:CHAD domain-containing protein